MPWFSGNRALHEPVRPHMTRWYRRACAATIASLSLLTVGCSGGSSSSESGPTGTVDVVVWIAPTCPVERLDDPCPPARASGIRVEVRSQGEVVTAGTTDARGRITLESPAGAVVVRAGSVTGLPMQNSERVDVRAGATTQLELTLDSGIR